ncbi:eosinophil peroxidase-like [Clupea harengus]|uniref:Eosinophil peroxidase-like n=1 Tax=Clupea harengus TaxID=7950 RepID=A0A6P8FTV5_CLUHA|nr:eosinophil peroxidase-like [Clupea harengus]
MARVLCVLIVGLSVCVLGQVSAKTLSRRSVLRAVSDAKKIIDDAYTYSRAETLRRVRKRKDLNPSDLLRLMKQPARETRSAVRAADYLEYTLQLLQDRHHIYKHSLNATDMIRAKDLETIADLTGCAARVRQPNCETTPHLNQYRTTTSVCNNRKFPRRGSSNTPFLRLLPAEYQDGVNLPQGWDPMLQRNGALLPLVRLVSNRILSTANEDVVSDSLYTHLITIFGQWTDHDLTFTPHSPSISSFDSGINCDASCEHTEPCFPINIPPRDMSFGWNSDECIPFFRSSPACGTGNTGHIFGAAKVREQLNALTAFLDVGQVYGADEGLARDLRDLTTDSGLLRVNDRFSDNGRELLPFSRMKDMCANRGRITNDAKAEDVPCSIAGDSRVDENIGLSSMHTMMMREHNRLARALAKLNPKWSGEILYQEARKIMGGYLQVITFRDYLLHIVGPDIFNGPEIGPFPGYDENVDPSISNVFATAAFRFGHLAIQPYMFRLDENYLDHQKWPSVLLHKNFFVPWRLVFEGGIDPVIRGLVGRQAKLNTQDHMMHDELRERLFEFLDHVALDLAALNMQRGRDHGLPGYNSWRGFCGLSKPQTEEELSVVMNNRELAHELMELYGTVDNIDVWLGGVAEPFVNGGRVGPLFACIIARQFQRIRQGDRLWWENDDVFTEAQRESLRATSLSRIICDNTGITEVPENPFKFRPRGSGYTRCEDIPAFDLSPWRAKGVPGTGEKCPPGWQGPPGSASHRAFAVRLGDNFRRGWLRRWLRRRTPIAFKKVIYNDQDLYNTKTGVFTCAQPGVYQFDFHCKLHKKKRGKVDLRHNKKLALRSFTRKQKGYMTATGGTILQLRTGDTVYLSTNSKHMTADSFFSGHILNSV